MDVISKCIRSSKFNDICDLRDRIKLYFYKLNTFCRHYFVFLTMFLLLKYFG